MIAETKVDNIKFISLNTKQKPMNKISAIQTVICIIGLISCARAIDYGEYAVIPAAGLMAFLLYRNLVNIKKIDND